MDFFEADQSVPGSFDYRRFRLHDSTDFPASMDDLEALARSALQRIGRERTCELILYLRNRKGALKPYMRMRGDVFLFAGAADVMAPPIEAEVVERLSRDESIFARDARQVLFPVAGAGELLGCLCYMADKPVYNRNEVGEIWTEVRKFGEQLYQAKVFEQATFDPESTLRNGASFYNDLNHEHALGSSLAAADCCWCSLSGAAI